MKKIIYNLAVYICVSAVVLSCKKDDNPAVVDCNTSGLSITATAVNSACSTNNGSITATGAGGKSPYTYSMDGNTFQADASFANLAVGDYTVTIKDANNCTTTVNAKVMQDALPVISSTTTTAATCGGADGGLQIAATGGKAPLQYSIDGTNFKTAADFTNLAAGSYTVMVKDASGCSISTPGVKVGVNPNTISFAAKIQDIVTANCAITGCHVSGGNGPGDFSKFDNLKAKANGVKTRTGNKSMPLGRTLTDEQIKQIACWVDAGAPNN